MKKVKKLLVLALAGLMLLSMAACGGPTNQPVNPGASVKLKIVAADFGYGTNWLKAIAQAYMSKNRDVSITVENTPIPHQVISQIEGGLDTYDMVFGTSGDMGDLGEKGVFVNLDDVYAAIPDGNLTVAEKLGTMAGMMEWKGHYYSMPYISSPMGMVVNHDTMRALYGENYTLPNTTDEFLAMGKEIKNKGAYAFIDSVGYTDLLIETWWAQYDMTAVNNYWNATVTENGVTKVAQNGESLNQPGKLAALQLAETLLNPKYGYNHPYAGMMEFQEAQLAFLGQGYSGLDNKLVAFMPNGAWLENEMEPILAAYPADFTMFRVPVISAIINVLPDKSVADDAELSALISAIDAGSTALSGTGYEVTQKDYNYVKNARMATSQNSTAHTAAIVSTCKNVEAAKSFLTFMASDEASAIAARELKGVTLPYGYVPSIGNGYEISEYVQSANTLSVGAVYLGYGNTTPVINGLGFSKLIGRALCDALRNGNQTAQEIYDSDNASFKNDWKYIIAGME